MAKKKIVVYGGTFAGVAAAAKAAGQNANIESITVIVPDVSGMLGGLGTAGGQNYFDGEPNDRGGSFQWWFEQQGHYYGVESMSCQLQKDLSNYGSLIKVMYSYDVQDVTMGKDASGKPVIKSVKVTKIKRADNGYIVWNESYPSQILTGDIFIDASDDGRLTRMANFEGNVGRSDWPEEKLFFDEVCCDVARQQAATLMFKVTGINLNKEDGSYYTSHMGVYGMDGGTDVYGLSSSKVYKFNESHKNGVPVFAIKPYNMAQNGIDERTKKPSNEWWVNALLIFNVDGRAYERDKGTKYYPDCMLHGALNVDEAWVLARDMINKPEFVDALRGFKGFENVSIVKENGKPVVGDVMYLRETIHNKRDLRYSGNGKENLPFYYAVTAKEALIPGEDKDNKAHCIGINYYFSDINAYDRTDLEQNKKYIWFHEVSKKLRPDILADDSILKSNHHIYMPYEVLTTPSAYNLLVPGVACSVSSLAWAKVRILPNLCVLGDAAGVAAAYAADKSKHPYDLNSDDIQNIQNKLTSLDPAAVLEKQST